ncbi:MAG: beta-ketoacyl synthase N-terminal-like domain-containing protein [Thermoanaerobaculia bacterium]
MSKAPLANLKQEPEDLELVAVVGMGCHFPGARGAEAFWQNLRQGRESITPISDEELRAAGVDEATLAAPNFVKAGSVLEDIEYFDAPFFDVAAQEALLMDPQQRMFLETCWEALESAGCDPARFPGEVGVFAGAGLNSYFVFNLAVRPWLLTTPEGFQALIGNEKDYLATRVAYKLNLHGPSVTVQTACSTSLVAVHMATQSLLNGECDLALAGGVTVRVPHHLGYFHKEGMPFSADGHCRAFDAEATGTIFGSGSGVVVLRRLADAVRDGDPIRAVIRASAVNNDGNLKIGYTAPSQEGQAQVISQALALAGVSPETISYVEAHGTGTPLGDPIEVEALTQVYRSYTDKRQYCALGAVKSNVGHLETAAGVAGLIKTVLMLEHGELVPSVHFRNPNPRIAFAESPFYVNNKLAPWKSKGPRRAAVSSFGIGGTNAHAIVEQAPAREHEPDLRPWQVLPLSAKSQGALDTRTDQLADALEGGKVDLADAAYTLQVGRASMRHRRVLIAADRDQAVRDLRERNGERLFSRTEERADRKVAFMFPGGGAQYVRMGREIYEVEPYFRELVDHCCEVLKPLVGVDLLEVLFPSDDKAAEATELLRETRLALPALFVNEYALARLWMRWGVEPDAMIGHSNGEYIAATLAGVFSLEDGLRLVAERAALMRKLPRGSMLMVPMGEEEVAPYLRRGLSLAAINSPGAAVLSGTVAEIDKLEKEMVAKGQECRRLHIAVGAHSVMAEQILEEFHGLFRGLKLNKPTLPFLSNVTGTWIRDEEAVDPLYWGRHLRHTVRFEAGITELLKNPRRVLLEVGPGQTLSGGARQNRSRTPDHLVLASTRHPQEQVSDYAFLMEAVGKLWVSGVPIDWPALSAGRGRKKVVLPTYPFERRRYWIDAKVASSADLSSQLSGWMEERGKEEAAAGGGAAGTQPRPNLMNAFVAPRNDTEGRIAEVWRSFFGFDQIGVQDNFFELGGTSLLATQLTNTLKGVFKVDLSVASFLQSPTIAGLAVVVAELHEKEKQARMTDLLARIEQLSDEEVKSLLAETT